jgi:hypothetical protein
MNRQSDQGGGVDHQMVSEHAIPMAPKLIHRHRRFEFSRLPSREVACRDAITHVQGSHARAQRHDFARPIGERDDTALSLDRVALLQNQQVTVVQRTRMDLDEHLIAPWFRHLLIVPDKAIKGAKVVQTVATHGSGDLS